MIKACSFYVCAFLVAALVVSSGVLYNMENVINHDVNKQYQNDNEPYRERILKRLAAGSNASADRLVSGVSFVLHLSHHGRENGTAL